ncbi:HU family DNA-binding protein [uncultured Muribaculum sp.]|uniref:HU family DNA-binding protein n=1 Tax=uncultured Muribaculum sp. TaxID=1918613 RepID=UPI0025AEFA4C|nr:HU family DNA-binding protein [uncultured Muribaculum sp.]
MEQAQSIIHAVAERLGRSNNDIATLIDAFSAEIGNALAAEDTVAIPGFGTFSARKETEHIVTDLSTGKRMLMPPSIVSQFKPGSRLIKAIQQ